MLREERLDDRALHSDPPPVDQPNLGEAARVGRDQVLVDDRGNVGGTERVQIEGVLDRKMDGLAQILGPVSRCWAQCWKLERSSPESLHCQNVAARSKDGTSTVPTFSARAVSATFCVTICRTNGIGIRASR